MTPLPYDNTIIARVKRGESIHTIAREIGIPPRHLYRLPKVRRILDRRRAKLEQRRRDIIRRYAAGELIASIARRYGIDQSLVFRIATKRTTKRTIRR